MIRKLSSTPSSSQILVSAPSAVPEEPQPRTLRSCKAVLEFSPAETPQLVLNRRVLGPRLPPAAVSAAGMREADSQLATHSGCSLASLEVAELAAGRSGGPKSCHGDRDARGLGDRQLPKTGRCVLSRCPGMCHRCPASGSWLWCGGGGRNSRAPAANASLGDTEAPANVLWGGLVLPGSCKARWDLCPHAQGQRESVLLSNP